MKKVANCTVVMAVLCLCGCLQAVQYGIGAVQTGLPLVGLMGSTSPAPDTASTPKLTFVGAVLETYQVGKYQVKTSDGLFKGNPCIHFKAYNGGTYIAGIYFEKDKPDDMMMIKIFNQLGQAEKKEEIRKWFVKYTSAKIDLGPTE